MNERLDEVVVRHLELGDAHRLAPLLAGYSQDQRRGAPPRPDEYYAELLLKDPAAEIVGALRDDRLVGFAVYLDLPDTMSGLRSGQLDDLFVVQDARAHGVGHHLVEAVVAEGRARGWTHLRWMVPKKPPSDRMLAERMAEPGWWESYVVPIVRERAR